MATVPTLGPARGHGVARLGRPLILPAVCGGLALLVAGSLGHIVIGLLVTVGLVLGAVNGIAAQAGSARLTADGGQTRRMVVHGSLRRLGAVTAAALVIAWLARPNGWTVLLGLAIYQLLSLGSALGAAMREVRHG